MTYLTHGLAMWIGVCLGVIVMCIVQINRIDPLDTDLPEDDETRL